MPCHLINNTKDVLDKIFLDMPYSDLAKYAKDGHGFVADEGAYWVLYSTDLDEYEVEVEGHKIEEGMVEIYHWAVLADGEVILLKLSDYLYALEEYFS